MGDEESLDSAIAAMETAVTLSDSYPIHFFELDRLYEAAGKPPAYRLEMLESHMTSVVERDDATARAINLLTVVGKADEAIELMSGRIFDIWEGGARFNPGDAWTNAHLVRGREHLEARAFSDALTDFGTALRFPSNLRAEETERTAPRLAEVSYWIGIVQEAMGDVERAAETWRRVATLELRGAGGTTRISANVGIQLYHQALALERIGSEQESVALFREIRQAGEDLLANSPDGLGYFTSFGERQSSRVRLASARYLTGLGHLGLGQFEMARGQFRSALDARPDHLGARVALNETGG